MSGRADSWEPPEGTAVAGAARGVPAAWREAFSPEEVAALSRAVPLAQELAGEHFALTDDWFARTSHRVLSAQDLRRSELLPAGALAQIRRVYRVLDDGRGGVLRCERLCPHYRICVQDHNVRARLRRDRSLDLPALLVGVLTHEYVHLVRFCRLEHPYHAPDELRSQEETRVEELTRDILRRSGHPGLRRAAESLASGPPA